MHGFRSGSTLFVNAEVDSMGGVIDGGVGIGTKTSPHRAAIEKAQAELRVEYDVREERRRELEFLEKGGNPLDFKFGLAASVSVQSTSLTDQHVDQFVTSEAKGSFALTASPRGDSVESSGRLGVTVACEPNSADNFDAENESLESERKPVYPSRSNVIPSERSSQLDGSRNANWSEDSPIFHPKKGQAYRRRNRSRTNRDGTRSSSTDVASRTDHGPLLPGRQSLVSKTVHAENQIDMELDVAHPINSNTNLADVGILDGKVAISANKNLQDDQHTESARVYGATSVICTDELDSVQSKEHATGIACPHIEKIVDHGSPVQFNEPSKFTGDVKCTPNEGLSTRGLDSESSCTRTSVSVDENGNIDSDLCTNSKKIDSNGVVEGRKLLGEEIPNTKDGKISEGIVSNAVESGFCTIETHNSIVHNHEGNPSPDKEEKEINVGRASGQNQVKCPSMVEEREPENYTDSMSHIKEDAVHDSNAKLENHCHDKLKGSRDGSVHEHPETDVLGSRPSPQLQSYSENQLKVVDKGEEDRILEEARIIEAKRKRIAELSVRLVPTEFRKKSHWDFVLDEMVWLANDFAQERLWKMTAAFQICHRVAFASHVRLEEQNKHGKLKTIAHTMAKAVMEFWHSSEELLEVENCKNDIPGSRTDEIGAAEDRIGGPAQGLKCQRKNVRAVQEYAVRFLKYNSYVKPLVKSEDSEICNRASDMDIPELSWQDKFTEENLFYIIPLRAMENYRKSIESHLLQCERIGNNMQEDAGAPIYDVAADNEYEEDERESVYYLPGAFEASGPLKVLQKKRKNLKSYAARSYEFGGDFAYGHCVENRIGTPQSELLGKRTMNSLNVGPIPTKRMRTASRHRIGGPFGSGVTGAMLHPGRTDASSGDTNSFQDDHSTLHGGSIVAKGSEVESGIDFDKLTTFDPTEVSAKPKKKKKAKHLGASYDHRWQVDSPRQNEQRDHLKKRLDSHQYESNGNSGFYAKKPKIMKQSDNSFENMTPMGGSIASPVASQMSNMSNSYKLNKLIVGRDRGRKGKLLKVPAGQPGFGNPWTLFEDQALVVLVHDMGTNWELVSDAINSALQFKCIFRKPDECKDRHKILMDRNSGDGADSAEDSGSSQPYPSTLPGIPKGSARQLFQRLQGPVEEDIIKSHFEKIILIGQQLHYRKKQNDSQDLKQLVPAHGSHVAALSQAMPNNVNGGVLTPLDLCDASASSPDVFSLACQASHSGSLAPSNQGCIASLIPSGANSSLQGSPGMGLGSNLTSPPSQLNGSVRDGIYGVPRATSLPIDEQQRIQQHHHMLSNKNIQQPNLSIPGAFSGTDRNVRMLSSGNGIGMMSGMNRNMPMPRPGFQGVASSAMLNPGTLVTANMGGMPSAINMNSGAGPGQGNSMLRPRDALHMVRPGQNQDNQRQMLSPEMQMQVTHANSQGVPPFGGLSSAFPCQSASPPVQTYPVHQQQHQAPPKHSNVLGSPHLQGSPHSATPEQLYAMRLARERQLPQRMLQRQQQQQQHQQFPASSALMSHVQPQSQLPLSSSLQNISQIQAQAVSQSVSLPPLTPTSPMTPGTSQMQQKHQQPPQGLGRTPQSGASGMMNQIGKQRHRQPQQVQQQFQQSGRHHPQQRQHSQSSQQAKLLKGMGRGNMLVHQNLALDSSHMNGISVNLNQVMEKGEQPMHLMQGQGLYSGSGIHSAHQSKVLGQPQPSGQSQPQQKQYSGSAPISAKQVQQLPSHPENTNQSQVPAVPSTVGVQVSNQALSPMMPSLNHQQLQVQPSLKFVNQTQATIQRPIQQSHQMSCDTLAKSQLEQGQLEQKSVNNISAVGTNPGIQPACIESTNPMPLPPPSTAAPWKAPESLCDSVMPNSSTQMGAIGSPPVSFASGNEPLPSSSQGVIHRQLSGNLRPHGQSVGTHWQQQQSRLQQPLLQPLSLPKQSHQQQQQQQIEQSSKRQLPLQQQSQQQIQAGQGSVLARSTNLRQE